MFLEPVKRLLATALVKIYGYVNISSTADVIFIHPGIYLIQIPVWCGRHVD